MAWTTPLTAVANSALTAAQWNASVRDNLLETAVGKATRSGSFFVGTGLNSLAERVPTTDEVAEFQSTSSTTYTDLATPGPARTVTTGSAALVIINCRLSNNTANNSSHASIEVSGATSISADDNKSLQYESATADDRLGAAAAMLFTDLTPGSNRFAMKYRVQPAGTGSFGRRRLMIVPF